MKLIKQSHFQDGTSDKVYEVDLCGVGNDTYLVNFRYGRRGQQLREGTKTDLPVSREEAEKIFKKLVDSKTKKGYQDINIPFTNVVTPEPEEEIIPEETPLTLETFELDATRKHHILKALREIVQPNDVEPLSNTETTSNTEIEEELPPSSPEPKQSESIFNRLKRFIDPNAPKERPASNARRVPTPINRPIKPTSDLFRREQAARRPLSRLVWRVGEFRIKEAVPYLFQVPYGTNPLSDYCLAWTIGRCGDAQGLALLENMTGFN